MACFATCSSLNVSFWPGEGILGNKGAVVAGNASGPGRSAMVHGRWLEGAKVVVAAVALRCRRNVGRRFA